MMMFRRRPRRSLLIPAEWPGQNRGSPASDTLFQPILKPPAACCGRSQVMGVVNGVVSCAVHETIQLSNPGVIRDRNAGILESLVVIVCLTSLPILYG
jgi:hypothetical protein